MRAAEEAAFATGVQVEALMNKAGAGVAQAVTKFFQKPGRCIVFAGKGHNAGDALFAAQCLEQRGWKTEVRLAFKEADFSNLMRKKLGDLLRRPPDVLGAAPSEAANADLVGTFGQFAPDLTEREPRRRIQSLEKRVRALQLRSLFWKVCLTSEQDHS